MRPRGLVESNNYLAVVLDKSSRARLLRWWKEEIKVPLLDDVIAHHMTVVFGPSSQDLEKYQVGSRFTIRVTGWAADDKAQAVKVETGLKTANKIPHVTVAIVRGGKTVYSNDLLAAKSSPVSGPTLSGILEVAERVPRKLGEKMSLRTHIRTLRATYEAKASADNLPEDPWRYFTKAPGAELVPVSKLKTIRARASGIENAAMHMAKAYNGEGDRRKPISVQRNDDGTYTVVDGNSTTAIAKKNNWKMLPVVIEEGRRLFQLVWHKAEELLGEDFEPGTIRTWKTGTMIKLASGDWAPYGGATKAQVPVKVKASEPHKMAANVQGIQTHQAAGKLPGDKTPEEQIAIAKNFLKKHENNLSASLERVQAVVVGDGTAVSGRVKDVDSAVGKLVRKPKYGTVEGLKDGTGMRIVCESVSDVLDSVKALKERFETSAADEEDYISKPKDGYRSYHLIIKDDDGLWKEIQVRTPNQDIWANWCHDVYKPQNQEQLAAVEAAKDEILAYGNQMSEYYFSKDQGKTPPDPPECPPVVQKTFGCLPEA